MLIMLHTFFNEPASLIDAIEGFLSTILSAFMGPLETPKAVLIGFLRFREAFRVGYC
jgi:hypothetical protein